MNDELKKYIKTLYLKNKVDATRFKELNKIAEEISAINNNAEEYQALFEHATGDYPEFKRFLTKSRLHAAEDLESMFMAKVDELISQNETEKAKLILEMLETLNQEEETE